LPFISVDFKGKVQITHIRAITDGSKDKTRKVTSFEFVDSKKEK
jgi:hypothetical protein